jgi:hypothetical protein
LVAALDSPDRNKTDQGSVWTKSVVRVGRGGRGFVVRTIRDEKLIITVARCVPRLAMTISHSFDYTYPRCVGAIDKRDRPVTVQCLFIDPVADLAVLGPPDDDRPYNAFVETRPGLPVGCVDMRRPECDAWMLSLTGEWFSCHVVALPRALMIVSAAERTEDGMSGSPIVDDNGRAIGAVSSTTGASQAQLASHLPGWLLEALGLNAGPNRSEMIGHFR